MDDRDTVRLLEHHENRAFIEVEEAPTPLAAKLRAFAAGYSFDPRQLGVFKWAPRYNRAALARDAASAAVVAFILLPQGMAYGQLAGCNPVNGLWSAIFPLLVFALFTHSSQLALGPAAPTSILAAGIVSSITDAAPGSPTFIRLVCGLGIVTGSFLALLSLLRFGWVASLLSWPVMSGFSSGAACVIVASQLKDLLGIKPAQASSFFSRVIAAARALGSSFNWRTTLVGLSVLTFLWFARDIKLRGRPLIPKRFPLPLAVMLAFVALSWAADFKGAGIAVVGHIPASLPSFSWPLDSTAEFSALLPGAIVLGIVSYVQTVTLAVMFGKKVGEVPAPGMELTGLAAAILAGSVLQCHAVSGSFTRTAVQVEAGAVTPMVTALTASFILVFLFTLGRVLTFLPACVLAAVVVSAVKPLVTVVSDARTLWTKRRFPDLLQLLVTFFAVLSTSLEYGVLIGMGFSLLTVIARSFRPRLAELGRLPDTDVFVAMTRYPAARPVPGVRILRLDGELHFGNVAVVVDKLTAILAEAKAGGGTLVIDAPQGPEAPVTDAVNVELIVPASPTLSTPAASAASTTTPAASSKSASAAGATTAARRRERAVYALAAPVGGGGRRASTVAAATGLLPSGGGGEAPSSARSDSSSNSGSEWVIATDAGVPPEAGAGGEALTGAPHSTAPLALRAVILDGSRVVDIDATACRELQLCLEAYAKLDRPGLPRLRLFFTGLPGPVRDTLDRFGVGVGHSSTPAATRFLSVAAAVASVYGQPEPRAIGPASEATGTSSAASTATASTGLAAPTAPAPPAASTAGVGSPASLPGSTDQQS